MSEKMFTARTTVAMLIAVGSIMWAVSGEIHNGRLEDLAKLEVHSDEALADRSNMWRALDKLVVVSENHQNGIDKLDQDSHVH